MQLNVPALIGAIAVTLLGALAVIGWHLHQLPLLCVCPLFVPIAYNTAIGFLLSGASLVLFRFRRRGWSLICLICLGLMAILSLMDSTGCTNLNIDGAFMRPYGQTGALLNGHMAISTAFCFLLTSIAIGILMLPRQTRRQVYGIGILASVVFALGAVGLSGYITEARTSYRFGYLTRMALLTTFGFMILGSTLLAATWNAKRRKGETWPCWAPGMAGIFGAGVTTAIFQSMIVQQSAILAFMSRTGEVHGEAMFPDIERLQGRLRDEAAVAGMIASVLVYWCLMLAQHARQHAVALQFEITERCAAQEELQDIREGLEQTVLHRTVALSRANDKAVAAARRERDFVRDMLMSVTDGRLRFCESIEDFPLPLPHRSHDPIPLTADHGLADLRWSLRSVCADCNFNDARSYDLVTAASEAAMNAVVHAGGGTAEVFTDRIHLVQVWICDRGTGIAMEDLPRATLERGFTTVGSFGHGIKMVLSCADKTWLQTGQLGTTILLEQHATEPPPDWIETDSRSN